MATKPRQRADNRRGSPEAIAKRRAARRFNDLLDPARSQHDGRTEKRRQRLLEELEQGKKRGGRELKPIEVLSAVDELLRLGEPIANLKRLARPIGVQRSDDELIDALRRLHAAYGFSPDAYAFLGLGEDVLRAAGVLDDALR